MANTMPTSEKARSARVERIKHLLNTTQMTPLEIAERVKDEFSLDVSALQIRKQVHGLKTRLFKKGKTRKPKELREDDDVPTVASVVRAMLIRTPIREPKEIACDVMERLNLDADDKRTRHSVLTAVYALRSRMRKAEKNGTAHVKEITTIPYAGKNSQEIVALSKRGMLAPYPIDTNLPLPARYPKCCPECTTKLVTIIEALGKVPKFCPECGEDLEAVTVAMNNKA
jgi:hypothetical protein